MFTEQDVFYAVDKPLDVAEALNKLAKVKVLAGKVANVSGTAQVETATVVGTVSTAGNASVVVTTSGMTGSPKTIPVAVALADTAIIVAGKIRTALNADTAVTAVFTVGGTDANVVLTKKVKAADDATLNIAVYNGTCAGLTTANTSVDTTAGVEPVDGLLDVADDIQEVIAVLAVVSSSGAFATKALLASTTDYTVSGQNLVMATDQHLNKLIVVYR